ncbi:fimbria/pilus periplasmic chaperone [Scandinavium sp. H11S7]|uniref:fimbrial biogenesis chaperone n=1 Tax=Scandinavium hiltneri TaxID=2926519 RepID=UPI0021656B2C|nr:fimbria/pilus periplasmic chaperone [Scandinavium hiltneri]MCS2159036.1 fimbria/pilus periplasmic chaperone [Scandinavium hiltneri]
MRNLFCSLLITLLAIPCARAGVVIGGTRVVYSEKQSSVALPLRNNSQTPWLINSKVSTGGSWPGSTFSAKKAPFVITPPLFALKAGRESTLRIIYTGGSLARDRESVFTLSIATIPSGSPQDNSVQVAIRSQLKLFYRPVGLQGSAQDASQKLRWTRVGKQLRVENPTPYYVTLFNLHVNGREVRNAGMVAPFSQRNIDGCAQAAQCPVSWQGINDFGRVLPEQRIANPGR